MSQTAVKRLQTELREIINNPTPLVDARPTDSLFTWLFVLYGSPGTVYEGGQYLGLLIFPQEYPFKPPAIKMITPSGRFETNVRLCFSMSDFHPEEWSPMWGVSTILTGLLSFMSETAHTYGSLTSTDYVKRRFARESPKFNLGYPDCARFLPHHLKHANLLLEASSSRPDTMREAAAFPNWSFMGALGIAAFLLAALLALR